MLCQFLPHIALFCPDKKGQTHVGRMSVRWWSDDSRLQQGAHNGRIKLRNAGALLHLTGGERAVLSDHESCHGMVFPRRNALGHGEMGISVFFDDVGITFAR